VKYLVTVASTGGPMTDAVVADLRRLGAGVELSAKPGWCEATFTIDATDAHAATALAIEGVRAVRGEIAVDAVGVVADPAP
jgi:hypothetical protein